MTNDLFEQATVLVPQTINVGRTLKEMSIAAGTPTKSAAVRIVLGTLDEHGEWRTDIKDTLVRLEDDLKADVATHPELRYRASMVIALLFTGKVNGDAPETATNATTGAMLTLVSAMRAYYAGQGLSIDSKLVWDAAKVLLGAELQQGNA